MAISDADEAVKGWVFKGVDADELAAAYAAAVTARERKQSPAPINTGFLNVFVEIVLAKRKAWFETWSGIVEMGQRLGVVKRQNESNPDFKHRVFDAAGITHEEAQQWQA